MRSATIVAGRYGAIALVFVMVLAGVVLPAGQRAAAAPNYCTWYTDQDIADTTAAHCRATFMIDPGVGNLVSRAQLLAAKDLYQAKGFDRQWLWYAPATTVDIPNTAAQLWSGCSDTAPRGPAGECPVNAVSEHPMFNPPNGALRASSITLRAFAFKGRTIVRACGNYLAPATGPNPVPSALVEKFDDRNRDGDRDPGEAGLAGWQFRIVRVASMFGDQGTGYVTTVGTDAAGLAHFNLNGVGPGTYAVEELGQSGWAPTTANPQTFTVNDGVGDAQVAHLRFGNAQTRADLAKVDFALVDPPARLDAHTGMDLTVEARIRNNGPADVTATDTIGVTVPDDCRAVLDPERFTRTLAAGASATVRFRVRLTCEQPSFHPVTFTNHLTVAAAGVDDPVPENNTRAFEHVFEVFDDADVRVTGATVDCPSRADVTETFDCVVTADVVNAGPYGPVTADAAMGLQAPPDCTVADTGDADQTLSLAEGVTRTVTSHWRLRCANRSYHPVEATGRAILRHLHVEDPVAGNGSAAADTVVEIFEPADLAADVVDVRCDEREANVAASECTATLTVTNNGPATDVKIRTALTLTAEPDCTADPAAAQVARLVLAAGASATVPARWRLACTGQHRHSVRVRGTVEADEPHAEDRSLPDNATTTVWGPGDVKPRSLPSAVNVGKRGVMPFALLSTPTFDALSDVDRAGLHFGRSGTEDSGVTCAAEGEDVNGDGRLDLICRADALLTHIGCTDTVALIVGRLVDGTRFQSEDTIKVTGCA
ncbi:MAG TPA: prealbumin-like fold domain-containing protein [Actinoplanes sp.]|nr:prealbumin-like fold domain-containing protein [Actinoplanes sp.]